MMKIVQINAEDILLDPEGTGEMLTDCLKRSRKMKYSGACECNGILMVLFEESAERVKSSLVLAPLAEDGTDRLCAELSERRQNGFLLRNSFRVKDQLWGLFEQL